MALEPDDNIGSTPLHKYTVSLPGLGRSSANRIEELRVDGTDFCGLVEKATLGWEQRQQHFQQTEPSHRDTVVGLPPLKEPATIWLDILKPSAEDIIALEQIFGISNSIARRMLTGVSETPLEPECITDDKSLYLCWAEVAPEDSSTSQYLSQGGSFSSDTPTHDCTFKHATEKTLVSTCNTNTSDTTTITPDHHLETRKEWTSGYVPVFPWMQPSATQVLSRLNLQKRPKANDKYVDVTVDPQLDNARRQYVQRTLKLLQRPIVVNMERTEAVIRHWGLEHEPWWQDVLNNTECRQRQLRNPEELAAQLGQGARELVGYRIVQVWICGPIMISLHKCTSEIISRVLRELTQRDPQLFATEALTIVQGLVEHWVHATTERLSVLEHYTDKMDRDLMHPIRNLSVEAANWTPIIARCRKMSLALLRRCQVNELVLGQLCDAMRSLWFPSRHGTNKINPEIQRPPLPLGRRLMIRDISGYCRDYQLGIIYQQLSRTTDAHDLYKKAERRLSRLHKILLDRQRMRLLQTQKEIHRYFRILVTVELVFLPIELWYNLDNLNGITTPGELQPDLSNDEDFWLTVLGIVVWAIAAIVLYAIYAKFFERKHATLRVKNTISSKRKHSRIRRQRHRQQQDRSCGFAFWRVFGI
ncbi:hypothetical protein H4S08_002500 [Coemansia sp. RSA 1365]|nr:hypothetical protein H4S08_002500 [Coemansia sp. RSA 1365]